MVLSYLIAYSNSYDVGSYFEDIRSAEIMNTIGKIINVTFKNIDMRGWTKKSALVAIKYSASTGFGGVNIINGTFQNIILDSTVLI